jgi:putative transcriptional regulator
MENLTGHFLVATPQMPDPRFQEQVIYLCAHSQDGAMGVSINKPNQEITMIEILISTNIPLPEGPLPPVYTGGPVETESGFILYSSESRLGHSLAVTPTIALSRESKLLEDIANGRGPKDYLFLLGCAGWGPGQLEAELLDNSWLTVPGDVGILFHTPDEDKWKKAARKYGIDISMFSGIVGNA